MTLDDIGREQLFTVLDDMAFREAEDRHEQKGQDFQEALAEVSRLLYQGAIVAITHTEEKTA